MARGIAAAFAEEGARVMVADINGAGAQEVAQSINGIAHQVDVADPDSVKAMAAAAEANFGAVDILVNNAGVTHVSGPLEHVTEDEFDHVMAVNNKAIFLAAKTFIPAMKAAQKGAILNVASTAGVSPRPNLSWYNASKGWRSPPPKPWRLNWLLLASGLMPSILSRVKPLCWPVSWEKTRLKCEQNFFPPFP